MLKNICIYNNKLFLTANSYLLVYSYKKISSPEEEKFSECLKIKLPMKYTSTLDAKLSVVNNYITGLKSLLIFVCDTKGQWNIFIYNDSFRRKLYHINVPAFSLGNKDDLFVSDGPAFLFPSRNIIHVYPLPYSDNKYTDFTFPVSFCKEFKVLQFKCVGPFKIYKYLYLLIISCNFSSQPFLKFFGYIFDIRNPVTSFEQLTINSFFPQCYEIVLKAAEIKKAIPLLKTDVLCIKNIEWKETAAVICTENECLIFSNSDLLYCCKLTIPLTNVMLMKTDFMIMSSGNINCVLTFENKFVFFLQIKQNESPEVVKQWTDINLIIIGDILLKGSKQILLLNQIDSLWQNNVILYDMSSFMHINALCHSSVPDNCLKSTLSGLARKIQSGKMAIREMELEVSEKSAATADALVKLNDYKVNAENLKLSQTFQQSLVDLILSKDENKMEAVPIESEPSLKFLEEKHQYINNRWIISLCFINQQEKCICYPNIKVLKRSCQLTCIQKLFVCHSENNVYANEYGKEINAKSRFYIILTLENVVFQIEEDIFMILNWYNGFTDEFGNEIFLNEDKKVLTQNQICIQTKITLSDIFKQSIQKDISSITDLLFIRSLQQCTNLLISSLHSDIGKLEDILMKNDSTMTSLHLVENSQAKCLVFNSDNSPLFGVHFIIMKSASNTVEIKAFSRSGNEACLLVHYLYQHLPKDVLISPCLIFKDECSEAKKNLVLCMKNEIDLLISSFNVHNISDEVKKSYIKLMSSQTIGTFTIPKIDYHRIRTVLAKRECITDMMLKNLILDVQLY